MLPCQTHTSRRFCNVYGTGIAFSWGEPQRRLGGAKKGEIMAGLRASLVALSILLFVSFSPWGRERISGIDEDTGRTHTFSCVVCN